MARTPSRAALQTLGVASLLALMGARPPDDARAVAAADELMELGAQGLVDARSPALRELVQPSNLPAHPAAHDAWYGQLAARMAPDTPLQLAMAGRPELLGVVRGPSYSRVVYDTSPALTVRVRRDAGVARVEAVERSACGLCGEPERFVTDLLDQVRRQGDADRRLMVDVELRVEGEYAESWRWKAAVHSRNVGAGYLRWLLDGARVVEADEDGGVLVELRDPLGGPDPHRERWPVVWSEDHWMVDYAGLSGNSALLLRPEDVPFWERESNISAARVEHWTPLMVDRAGGTLVADDVLYFAPRESTGDLLVYTQDMGRTAAMLLQLDVDTGEVQRRARLPTLGLRTPLPAQGWGPLFVGATSLLGRRMAVAARDRLWLIDLDAMLLVKSLDTGPEVRSLAWSPDGQLLALGDERGAVRVLTVEGELAAPIHWPAATVPVHALLWPDNSRVVAVWADGRVGDLSREAMAPGALDLMACCGAVRGASLDARSGELVVGCAGACDPAVLWVSELLADDEPEVLADQDFYATDGTVSVDPMGRYRLTPSAREGGAAALWDARSGELIAVFAERPLRQVEWTERRIWGLDAQGRLWRWELSELDAP